MTVGIVVVGSLNADLVVRVERFPAPGETVLGGGFTVVPGGKGANQACAAGRLGAAVSMVGAVGADGHGDLLRESLASAGVDVSLVRRDPHAPTGIALIAVDRAGENQIVVVPGANVTLSVADVERSRERMTSAAAVLLQLEVPLPTVEAAAGLARRSGALVMLDPAPAAPLPATLLEVVDYLTPNETELAALVGSGPLATRGEAARAAGELLGRGARNVVVKLGEQGALLVTRQGEVFWPAFKVTAVDVTAAGDAWNAAFAFELGRGGSEEAAGRFANAAAACSVMRPGAQPSLPARGEVEALLARWR